MFDPNQLDTYPLDPGVYLMKNALGTVIYVGKAKSLKKRIKQYFGHDTRATVPHLLQEMESIDTIVVFSEKEALLLEQRLIKKHQPKYNFLLKDDKSYLGIAIDPKEEWPKLRLTRFQNTESSLYFGPYTNSAATRTLEELLHKLFPLRECSNEEFKRRTRPCILYSMKRCLAPCVQKCSKEEYTHFVESAICFLQGKNKELLSLLKSQMNAASEALEYEKAGTFLRTIEQLEKVVFNQINQLQVDAIGLYRQGEKVVILRLLFREHHLIESEPFFFENVLEEDSSLLSSFLLQTYRYQIEKPREILLPFPLEEAECISDILKEESSSSIQLICPLRGDKKKLVILAQKNAETSFHQKNNAANELKTLLLQMVDTFHLQEYPSRIECFDISHLGFAHTVASCVCFIDGIESGKESRCYHLQDKQDDLSSMKEVLYRRLQRSIEKNHLPNLIIVDGGKLQLDAALSVLNELEIVNVDLLCLVKQEGRHDKGLTLERIFIPQKNEAISLSKHSNLLFFLQNIRDRAHEKALGFHQKSRKKALFKGSLDEIEGIGPIKRKRLLKAFGSAKNIFSQTEESLLQVPGITKKDAKTIHSMNEL